MNSFLKNVKTSEKAITLIALVVTIVILLILASISIAILSGDNGLIGKAGVAKESAEIDTEKEIVKQAVAMAMGKNKYGNVEKEELQKQLDDNAGEGKAEVLEDDSDFVVQFIESNRYYKVDIDGNISGLEIAKDNTPGDITKDKDGKELNGDDKPFEIWSIEDLVTFSNMTNGNGYKLVDGQTVAVTSTDTNFLKNKKVVLKQTLNFNSNLSYIDSTRTDFGDINGDTEDGNELKTEMTTGTGFRPILNFEGSFNGENHEIKNIFIDSDQNAALFVGYRIEKIENLGITGKIMSSGALVAGIYVGSSWNRNEVNLLENCWNEAEIIGCGENTCFVAGIGARFVKNFKNCYNAGNITNGGSNVGRAGGIASSGDGNIENCYNTGNITGKYYTGGISSDKTTNLIIKECYNTGNISGGSQVGGIIGASDSITAEKCYNTGNVSAPGNTHAGGIVGSGATSIVNCYNTGDIFGNYGGGICESISEKMVNCYNTGNVSNGNVGGLMNTISAANATIENCFNSGYIYSDNSFAGAGGLIKANSYDIKILNCYNIAKVECGYNNNQPSYTTGGLLWSNSGNIDFNKCYYLKTEWAKTAIRNIEDSSEELIVLNNSSEITVSMLNANRTTIQHTDEWKEWINGPNGYPILKFELDEKGFIK